MAEPMFWRSFLKIAAFLVFGHASYSQGASSEIEILSKDDARSIFAMTRAQWTTNAQRGAAAGQAKMMGTPESGIAMVMSTPKSELIVKPDYSNSSNRPAFKLRLDIVILRLPPY